MILAYTKGAFQANWERPLVWAEGDWSLCSMYHHPAVTTADLLAIIFWRARRVGCYRTALHLKECSCCFHFLHAKELRDWNPPLSLDTGGGRAWGFYYLQIRCICLQILWECFTLFRKGRVWSIYLSCCNETHKSLLLATSEPEVCETDLVGKIVCKCGLNISTALK